MTLFRALVVLSLPLALSPLAIGCAGTDDDDLSRACRTIVDDCKVGHSVGDCVDQAGFLSPDCLACVADNGCGYSTCQRLPDCRIPLSLLPGE